MPDPITPDADAIPTPPWGTEENFDASRAWTLIEKLRAEKLTLKGEVDTLTTERQALSDAKDADTARATKAERELHVERALRKFAVPDDLVDFITGDTEEEILAKAERLSKVSSGAPGEPKADDPPAGSGDPAPDPSGRPKPALTPGHNGEDKTPVDLDAIADAARKSY